MLEVGELAVWWGQTEALSPVDLESMCRVLSMDERQRQRRFVFERDRRDFGAAHAMLREALSSCDGRPAEQWRFETDAHGKPHIHSQHPATTPLAFNLSHTPGLIACTIARSAGIGIDVEQIGRVGDARAVASSHFAASEIQLLDACASHEYASRFIELWTLKEAFAKGIGLGLDLRFDTFAFAFVGRCGLEFTSPRGADGWDFLLAAPSAVTRLAVAVRSTGRQTRWHVNATPAFRASEPAPTYLRWSPGIEYR